MNKGKEIGVIIGKEFSVGIPPVVKVVLAGVARVHDVGIMDLSIKIDHRLSNFASSGQTVL